MGSGVGSGVGAGVGVGVGSGVSSGVVVGVDSTTGVGVDIGGTSSGAHPTTNIDNIMIVRAITILFISVPHFFFELIRNIILI